MQPHEKAHRLKQGGLTLRIPTRQQGPSRRNLHANRGKAPEIDSSKGPYHLDGETAPRFGPSATQNQSLRGQ